MFLLFGLLLVFTAIQLFRHRGQDPSVEDNVVVSVAREHLPVTDEYDEERLTTRIDGKRFFTPLFLVLLAIGSVDILFALDSTPAIFGITDEVIIVFTANAFALLGLRSFFFLFAGLLDRLDCLSSGLALVLAFIGVKLGLHWGHPQNDSVPEISTTLSLALIGVVLTITTIASLVKSKRDPTVKAHAGSLRAHPSKSKPDSPGNRN